MASIPTSMCAVQITAYDGKQESISTTFMPVPRPGPGQVLVKVFASPVNPSDLLFLRSGSTYPWQGEIHQSLQRSLPIVPGFEGSGTVVDAGPGILGRFLKGRRVACATADARFISGMWAEYVVTSARLCIPLRRHVTLEQGAVMLVNPLTAWALIDEARRGKHKALIQTAAASAVGRMVIRLGQRFSIPVINVVRRVEQAELLKRMGADYVVNSSDKEFQQTLRELCHTLKVTIGFDAVSGELCGEILRAMPRGARLLVYGSLSLEPCRIDPACLAFEEKRFEGFALSAWANRKNFVSQMLVAYQMQDLLGTDLRTDFQARVPLQDAARGLQQYAQNMTAGKVLLVAEPQMP